MTLASARQLTSRVLSGPYSAAPDASSLPTCFALATISAAANGSGKPRDVARNERKAAIVAAYLEAAEIHGFNTVQGQELALRAGRAAREGERF